MEAYEDAGGASRQTKSGRRLHDSHGAAAGDDLISGLCDDVLLRILGCVADARDVVRTGALSRRWRGLWTRVPVIYFHSLPPGSELAHDNEPFIAFVNDVLALRAQSELENGVEHLEISFWMRYTHGEQKLAPRCIQVAEGWIRYAVQHAVRSFHFQLCPVLTLTKPQVDYQQQQQEEEGSDEGADDDDDEEMEMEEEEQNSGDEEESDDDDEETPMMALDNVTSSGKLETMFLALEGASVRLPSTVVFASLSNLTIESIELAADSGHLLGRLLSSACCPRLQKLRIWKIQLPDAREELVLEAGALSELWLEQMGGMRSLELRTPNLLDLEIYWCNELEELNVAAPRLEKLACAFNPSEIVVNGDLRSVRILKIDLCVHRALDYYRNNETSICLLQSCGSAGHLVVYLLENVPRTENQEADLIKDKIPQLPHITSLVVHPICDRNSFGIGVASLLSRFNNLRYLILHFMKDELCSKSANGVSCFVCDHAYHRKSSDISLASLQEAEFRGLAGTDCEVQFLKCVLSSAVELQKLAVNFKANCPLDERRDNFKHMY